MLPHRRDVHADDASGVRDRRPAAHARVDRSGEVDLGVERVLQVPVVGPLDDAEPEVRRVAERVEPLALLQGDAAEREMARRRPPGAQDREIVDDVDRDHLDRARRAVGLDDLHPVVVALLDTVRDHVVVRQHQAVGTHEEPGADAHLGVRRALDDADLEDPVAVPGEDGRRRLARFALRGRDRGTAGADEQQERRALDRAHSDHARKLRGPRRRTVTVGRGWHAASPASILAVTPTHSPRAVVERRRHTPSPTP